MTKLPPDTQAALAAVSAARLEDGWKLAPSPEGPWSEAQVPGTVAASLRHDLDTPGNYDARDWHYRVRFPRPAEGRRHHLRLEGLATLAEASLNGTPILSSRNMFRSHEVDVTALLRDDNELAITFSALDAELARRRPRPRWKTALVDQQNLRWIRTTLLGRIPAWSPAVAPVGPWAPVVLESAHDVDVRDVRVQAWAEDGRQYLNIEARVEALGDLPIEGARLHLGDSLHELRVDAGRVVGALMLEGFAPWWPHTHGVPHTVACRIELHVGGHLVVHDCGPVGFKSITLDESGGGVRFVVNGVPVFCRGAVWTTADILRLRGEGETLRAILSTARDAGINMLRIGATMAYESEEFHHLCDELGILVWQDFMFANMDYPVGDADFRAGIEAEVEEHAARLARHPSTAVFCGGSEIAQQAAMLGLPSDQWCNEFFAEALPRLVARHHPRIPYFPSTPWGGALPMHVASGISHYYGVGAYRRPLADARAARVKFAAECLGFSNVPQRASLEKMMKGEVPPPHHPRWKARVPRDRASGYDFEDVRDHYLRDLFGLDPVALRSQDVERYHALSRVASGEVMARTYSEWRAPASGCGGALVWFYRDLWPGAGWGLTDSDGTPKSAWWYLRRAWAPRTVRVTDEGLDGLAIHVLNEPAQLLEGAIEIELLRDGRPTSTRGQTAVCVPARGAITLSGDAVLGHFTDSTNAYRFGPAKHDVVVVRLRGAGGELIAEDFHFPMGLALPRQARADVEAGAVRIDAHTVVATLACDTFLQAVTIECDGYRPDDNFFHLAPGQAKHITFTAGGRAPPAFKARFEALNAPVTATVRA